MSQTTPIDKKFYIYNTCLVKFIQKFAGKHPTLWEIFKFIIVGGIATVIDFMVMGIILYVWTPSFYSHNFLRAFVFWQEGNPEVWATVIGTGLGFAVSLVFNYILSIFFVFTGKGNDSKKAKTARGTILFIVLAVIGLGIHVLGMYLGKLIGINEWIVKVILTLVVLIFNYITRKKLIFTNKKETL